MERLRRNCLENSNRFPQLCGDRRDSYRGAQGEAQKIQINCIIREFICLVLYDKNSFKSNLLRTSQ